uniref:Uncharacterized protein n=1 Tax=Anguilla anguilla TaxID=7936 RepID=A0A0E9Y1P7_ANGAN
MEVKVKVKHAMLKRDSIIIKKYLKTKIKTLLRDQKLS